LPNNSPNNSPPNPPSAPQQDWPAVEQLFHAIADLPAGDQTREVTAATANNPWLRDRVLELARADRGATRDSLVHIENATHALRAEIESSAAAPKIPERIGPYIIKSRIAQGGFGVVYLAEQIHPIRREVALKVVRPGFDIALVLSRFEAERQTLARLTHPNIARILDAGQTEDQRPYFAMEYVPGGKITTYCDEHKLSIPQRLRLFVAACRAIHHAHQKAVVHRDIKPSNVLVAESDGHPIVKVIDFGIAKLLDASLELGATRQTIGTTVGTPEYMSPEQASRDGGDIDVRSDIYSLGVLVYELTTGLLPRDPDTLRALAPAELFKSIASADTAAPTRRLRDAGDKAEPFATARGLPSARALREVMRGDLSTIIQKATAREQSRRYQDAQTLADDIERYLELRPITAREPSIAYRTSCFLRRHRTRLLVATLASLFILVTTFSIWSTINSREQAVQRATRDKALAYDLAIDSISAASLALEKGDATTARERLRAVPMQHRQWEWRVLWGWATRESDFATVPHTSGRMAMNQLGSRLAVSGNGDLMSVVNTDTGKVIFNLPTGFWTPGIAWHPKTRELAIGQLGGIWIGNPDHPQSARTLASIGIPMGLAYSPDGQYLAGLYHRNEGGKAVRIINAQTGELVVGLAGAAHMAITALRDRNIFIWGEVGGELVAYDMTTRREIGRVRVGGDSISSIVVADDNSFLVAASQRDIAVIDTANFTVRTRMLAGHSPFDLALSADGSVVYSVGEDSVLRAFSTTTGTSLQATSNTLVQPHALAIDNRHNRLYVGVLSSGRIASFPTQIDAGELRPGPSGAKPNAFFVGNICAVQKATQRGSPWIRDTSEYQFLDNQTLRTLSVIPSERITGWGSYLAPHPTDSDLYWVLQNQTLELRRVSDSSLVRTVSCPSADRLDSGRTSPHLIVKNISGGWTLRDLTTGEILTDHTSLEGVLVEGTSPDGTLVQCSEVLDDPQTPDTTKRSAITTRDAFTGERLAIFPPSAGSWGIFTPDSSMHIPIGNRIRILSARTGQLVREFSASDGSGFNAVTPDNSRIIAASSTSVMTVWDFNTGRRVAQLPFSGLVAMHHDGTLAVIGSDRILRMVRPSGDINDPRAAPLPLPTPPQQ